MIAYPQPQTQSQTPTSLLDVLAGSEPRMPDDDTRFPSRSPVLQNDKPASQQQDDDLQTEDFARQLLVFCCIEHEPVDAPAAIPDLDASTAITCHAFARDADTVPEANAADLQAVNFNTSSTIVSAGAGWSSEHLPLGSEPGTPEAPASIEPQRMQPAEHHATDNMNSASPASIPSPSANETDAVMPPNLPSALSETNQTHLDDPAHLQEPLTTAHQVVGQQGSKKKITTSHNEQLPDQGAASTTPISDTIRETSHQSRTFAATRENDTAPVLAGKPSVAIETPAMVAVDAKVLHTTVDPPAEATQPGIAEPKSPQTHENTSASTSSAPSSREASQPNTPLPKAPEEDNQESSIPVTSDTQLATATDHTPVVAPSTHTMPHTMDAHLLREQFDLLVLSAMKADQQEIRIQIEPATLGHLSMTCRQTRNGLDLNIDVQSPEVRTILTEQEQTLRLNLEAQGLQLGQFSVSCQDRDSQQRNDTQFQHEDQAHKEIHAIHKNTTTKPRNVPTTRSGMHWIA